MTPAAALALLQAAWDSGSDWTDGLPPIAFTEAEAVHLVGAIAAGLGHFAVEAPAATDTASGVETIERLRRVRTSMILLQQNSEGCALNHHGDDSQTQGMPGWLMDTAVDIERLTDIIAAFAAAPAIPATTRGAA